MVDESFEVLKGKTIVEVRGLEVGSDDVSILCDDGTEFLMYHSQDCCESVSIEDICGDVEDLKGALVVLAEEVTSEEPPEGTGERYADDAELWTFYKLETTKGPVTIRWYGTSNGYYSVSVDFCRVK